MREDLTLREIKEECLKHKHHCSSDCKFNDCGLFDDMPENWELEKVECYSTPPYRRPSEPPTPTVNISGPLGINLARRLEAVVERLEKVGNEEIATPTIEETVSTALNYLMKRAYETAKKRGKLKHCLEESVTDIIAECVEVVGAAEAPYYKGDDGKPEGYLVELIDVFVATLTLMYQYGINYAIGDIKPLEDILIEKMQYNEQRED